MPADTDIFITDSAEAREDDPGSDDEAVEEPSKFKVEKSDKYYGNRKKLEPWLLQLAVNFFWDPRIADVGGGRTVYAAGFMRDRAFT